LENHKGVQLNKSFHETQEGFKNGTAHIDAPIFGLDEYGSKVKMVGKICEELNQAKIEFWKKSEKSIVDLVISIAKKICLRELSVDPNYPMRLVRSVIETIGVGESVKIRLNTKHSKIIEVIREDIREYLGETVRIRFEFSDAISEEGCIIDTDLANVDTHLDRQLQTIHEALLSE
jgi:flagellar biosynthesis/type III secretory pathway protein FliH